MTVHVNHVDARCADATLTIAQIHHISEIMTFFQNGRKVVSFIVAKNKCVEVTMNYCVNLLKSMKLCGRVSF